MVINKAFTNKEKKCFKSQMDKTMIRFRIILLIFLFSISCSTDINTAEFIKTMNQCSSKIEYRDSLLVTLTVKTWNKYNISLWRNKEPFLMMSIEDVKFYVLRTFYSPDKLKSVFWVVKIEPNAIDRTLPGRKNCMLCGDSVLFAGVVYGVRDNVNKMWNLFPLDCQWVESSENDDDILPILCEKFFYHFKNDGDYIYYNNNHYGGKILQIYPADTFLNIPKTLYVKEYGYNMQDKEFWEKNLIWQKGSVRPGYYSGQLKSHVYNDDQIVKFPQIAYPDSLLKMYEQ